MAYDEERYLAQAHPVFKMALQQVLRDLRALRWQPRIVYVKRSASEQAAKIKAGHSKTMKSWHVASTVGHLPNQSGGYDVVHGNAADIVDARYGWGGPAAVHDFKFWLDLGTVAKKYGCAWGGDWKRFKDVAHIQMLLVDTPSRSSATV